MSTRTNPTIIGAFVLGAILLSTGGTIAMGSWTFEEEIIASACFENSVAGLSVGSAVRFRGFDVGTVRDIYAEYSGQFEEKRSRAPAPPTESDHLQKNPIVIYVTLTLLPGKIRKPAQRHTVDLTPDEALKILINDGLFAKLAQESLVTGRAFVALDFDLERPAPPQDGVGLVIPTQPGGFLESLEEMDLKVVKEAILKMIATTDGLLSNKDIPKILNNLNTTLTTFNESTLPSFEALLDTTIPNIESLGSDLKIQMKKTAERLDGVLEQAQTALANAGALVDEDSGTVYRLKRLLDEWTTTSRSISSFVEFLERHPEALLFGKGK
jgi:paraquat-inducible protein B